MSLPPGRGMDGGTFIQMFHSQEHEAHEIATRNSWVRASSAGTSSGMVSVERNAALLDSPPECMLRAVVTLGDKTEAGHVIDLVTPAWFEIVAWMDRDPKAMFQFDWRKWEEIVAGAYRSANFDVILTPRSNDRGRDVIATRDDLGSIRIIEQVKAYSPGETVPANDVRALIGVLDMERNVSKGVVTTTSDFAPGVYTDSKIQELIPNRLELRNGTALVQWLRAAAARRGKA